MYSPAQLERLGELTQGLLDGWDFGEIRTQIEEAVPHPKEWQRARNFKMPVASAIGHMCTTRAIEMGNTGRLPFEAEGLGGLSPYEQYDVLTAGIDRAAGKEVIIHIDDMGSAFTAAFDYYAAQIDVIRRERARNPSVMTRRGKSGGLMITSPGELLILQQSENARHNTPSLIVREAVRISYEESAVPEPAELAQRLRDRVGLLSEIVSMPSQTFYVQLHGATFASRWRKALQTETPLPTPYWNYILRQQAEGDGLSDVVPEIIVPVTTQTIEEEVAQIESIRKNGSCAAQLALRPHERPGQPGTNREHTTAYFESRGVTLEDGAFSVISYQLHRGIDVAERTLFVDGDIRAAIQTIAQSAVR